MKSIWRIAHDTSGEAMINARIIGIELVVLGIVLAALFSIEFSPGIAWGICGLFAAIGLMFIAISFRGGIAKYRTTQFTRYPQQTGEIDDLFLQIFGEDYLWFRIGLGFVMIIAFAWLLKYG